MSTTTYRLKTLPANPPGRTNGRAGPSPPPTLTPRRPAGEPWDERWVRRIWWWLRLPFRIVWAVLWDMPTTYPQIRGIVLAHVLGPVSRRVRAARLKSCGNCPHRVVVHERAYCGRCACGTHPAARLNWKTWLRAATCPVGRWATPVAGDSHDSEERENSWQR